MSLTYKNPTAIVTLVAPQGVARNSTQGTNFSVSMVGGYQEVYYLENLNLTFSGTGFQTLSANTIPIQINIGNNSGLSYTKLTLNSDNISSGRRKLGMLAYVQETDTVYQYSIPNYDTLWSEVTAQTGSASVFFATTYTEVNDRSQEGKNFISAWTGSTIEGVNGVIREDARWKVFQGSNVQITGGTYYSAITTLDLYNSSGGTVTITGFTGTITGGTYNGGTSTLTLNNSDGSSVQISGFTSGGGSSLSVGDGTTTVTSVSGITFSGASVTNDGGGNVTVTITGGTSGSPAVIISGTGINSSVRRDVSNIASGSYSAALAGTGNTTNARMSFIGGGNRNVIQSPINECCSLGVTIGGGIGHNTSGGTFNSTTGLLTGTIVCCDAGKLSTIGGGYRNCATGLCSTIAGGSTNYSSAGFASTGGGFRNINQGSSVTIGGGRCNCNSGNNTSSTISGGYKNTTCASSGGGCMFIGGGGCNTTCGCSSTVAGGLCNSACAFHSSILGGRNNTINSNSSYASIVGGKLNYGQAQYMFIGGGCLNCGVGNNIFGTIGGGSQNKVRGDYGSIISCNSVISGGKCNCTCGSFISINGGYCNITNTRMASIGGGNRNVIKSPNNECCSLGATIGGGIGHNTSGGTFNSTTGELTGTIVCCDAGRLSTIGGGYRNCATGACSTIAGGSKNYSSDSFSVIGGGSCNTTCGCSSTIVGGLCNSACAIYSSILGGRNNTISSSFQHANIIGSCITANRSCTTFVNDLSVCSFTGSSGCNVGISSNGLLIPVAPGGGGGSSIIITGTGVNSTIRCGVSNTASSCFSAALAGSGNTSSACFSTIVGGQNNSASGSTSFIGGGCNNSVIAFQSTIVGGNRNTICNFTTYLNNYEIIPNFIGGGSCNIIFSNTAYDTSVGGSSIVGGSCNKICSPYGGSSISGGFRNVVCGDCSFIGAGWDNKTIGCLSFIGSGEDNITCGLGSTIGGGACNRTNGFRSIVGGGTVNCSCANYSSILGGRLNTVCSVYSSILGGRCNTISSGFTNSNIIGSNITANRACTTFVNDLSVCSFTGSSGCNVGISTNGLLIPVEAGGGGGSSSIIITGTGVNSTIRCGVGNSASGCYSAALAGTGNTTNARFSFIGGGRFNNVCSDNSSIIGGQCNIISSAFTNSNIIGSNITANRACTTFVNDLSVCSFTGSSGCNVGITTNGLLIPVSPGGGLTPIKLTGQTLTAASWTLVGGYYTYSFSNVNITANCDVSVTPQNASYLTAYNAQVLPYVGVASGVATFYSQFPPDANMTVDIIITQTT
jgi:hypothetical protein